jgi:hypothetical protein
MMMLKKLLLVIGVLSLLPSCLEIEKKELSVQGLPVSTYYERKDKTLEKGTLLNDFNATTKGWFGCKEVEISVNESALKADFINDRFVCIGGKINIADLSDKKIITLRMRAKSETFKEDSLTFVVRFEDMNGVETNYSERTYNLGLNEAYKTFELDFSDRLVAVNGDFDDQNIVKMKIFFNTDGSTKFTGSVWVDEIRAKAALSK